MHGKTLKISQENFQNFPVENSTCCTLVTVRRGGGWCKITLLSFS